MRNHQDAYKAVRKVLGRVKRTLFPPPQEPNPQEKAKRSLKARIEATKVLKIVLGSSGVFDKGWISTEIEQLNILNVADWKFLFGRRKGDAILAEHVFEHLSEVEGQKAFRYCYRFLKPGGYLRLAVPDGNHPNSDYIEYVKPGGYGPGSDDHKTLYNIETLTRSLQNAGFRVQALEYFDSNHQFVEKHWSPEEGCIHRSRRFDARNQNGELKYTSLIVDAIKPQSTIFGWLRKANQRHQ